MALLDIIIAPDSFLRETARSVDKVDNKIVSTLEDMLQTMYAAQGIGLAATQVGIDARLVVIDIPDDREPESATKGALRMINPEIISRSTETSSREEGCLSIPGCYAEVTRPHEIEYTYLDIQGALQRKKAKGLLAACIQHEIDHLDGKLFVDYLSPLRRNMFMKRTAKMKREKQKNIRHQPQEL